MDWRDIKAVLFYAALFGSVVLALAIQSEVKLGTARDADASREAVASPVTASIAATDIRRVGVRNGR
jgi:hypothetical protein